MNRKKILAIVSAATVAYALSGCAGSGGCSLTDAADRFANVTVGPEYEALVQAGYAAFRNEAGEWVVITDLDAQEKEDRLANVRSFRRAVDAEKAE